MRLRRCESLLELEGGVGYIGSEDGDGRRRITSGNSVESFIQFGGVTTCYDEDSKLLSSFRLSWGCVFQETGGFDDYDVDLGIGMEKD